MKTYFRLMIGLGSLWAALQILMFFSDSTGFFFRDLAVNHPEISRNYPAHMLTSTDLAKLDARTANAYRQAIVEGRALARMVTFSRFWSIAGGILLMITAGLGLRILRSTAEGTKRFQPAH